MGVGGRGMVVDVGLFPMLLLLLILAKVMAMRQLVVVVLVGVPGGTMLPLFTRAVMMGEMVVIMAVDGGWVCMLRYLSLPFDLLLGHRWIPFHIYAIESRLPGASEQCPAQLLSAWFLAPRLMVHLHLNGMRFGPLHFGQQQGEHALFTGRGPCSCRRGRSKAILSGQAAII